MIDRTALLAVTDWIALGATFWRERGTHPNGLIPDGALVVKTNTWVFERETDSDTTWYCPGEDTAYRHADVQSFADEYGFDVLWPRPELPQLEAGQVWRHEDGSEWMAQEEDCSDVPGLARGAWWGPCEIKPMGFSSTSVLATAEGLIAAGFRLDTSKENKQ